MDSFKIFWLRKQRIKTPKYGKIHVVALVIAATFLGGCSTLDQIASEAQEPEFNPTTHTRFSGSASGNGWSVRF